MFHYYNIVTQLNDNHDKGKRAYESQISSNDLSWIDWFSAKSPWILPVEYEFAEDPFNSYGVQCNRDLYDNAMKIILMKKFTNQNLAEFTEDEQKEAINIYTQIHQRYVTTPEAITIIKRKYTSGMFGICPRFNCDGQHLLPIGMDYDIGLSKICGWCPKCHDIYELDVDVDGAYYGPTFPHFFQQMAKDVTNVAQGSKSTISYMGIPLEPQYFS
ncbi:Casein kinase II regulatory subunit family protein [Trichomonas vaginalis G3]|uniref:Casein kinase II subunit beta n=1 Tax=Trichomonas vaginalis (strain ATCC PRA-98 / G3) TaxID=412133 RepID=A2G4G6_TRIV3|nr:protein kinase regulator protein [Trichomonas vaginalis G3]EAX87950.1 Casein kinase II regulatory subunit family protein [Trichomonas vaginalis G3]KAI5490309.1 protein kinase regulator protein [Trichomonas vaginalis G3]|eukprot:XP_001300880.1 Casein kinase II regulatory subunit family protein [Trichomonas vaginalis G3]